jgi:hypothetical protein
VGILSVLFGRNRLKKPDRERFFSVATAADSLAGRTDVVLSGQSGVVFNPVDSGFFQNLDGEIRDLLEVSGRQTNAHHELIDDSFGTRWVVVDDPDFEDLVATVHLVAETISDHGFGDRLIAAVFRLSYEGKPAYWIYNYKSGRFYPFVPLGSQQRDNNAEMRLGVLMETERLPVQKSLEQWYALWGIPF